MHDTEQPTGQAVEDTADAERPTEHHTSPPAPGPPASGTSDGGAEGYRSGRTLPVGVELRRQFRRRRTYLALTLLALIPPLVLLAFELGGHGGGSRESLVGLATTSGPNFAVFTLFASANFLLVVVVALFFGDTVAGEASWSSLKYLLTAPIPRARLLRQKAVVSAILSVLGITVLTLVALGLGMLWYGGGSLLSPDGGVLPFPSGLVALAGAAAFLAVHLMWIAGLALLLSVSTDSPLGAVGGAVAVSTLSQILDEITSLGELRTYLPTHYSGAWTELLTEEIDWTAMANGAFSAMTYATVFAALALYHFHRKDITS